MNREEKKYGQHTSTMKRTRDAIPNNLQLPKFHVRNQEAKRIDVAVMPKVGGSTAGVPGTLKKLVASHQADRAYVRNAPLAKPRQD